MNPEDKIKEQLYAALGDKLKEPTEAEVKQSIAYHVLLAKLDMALCLLGPDGFLKMIKEHTTDFLSCIDHPLPTNSNLIMHHKEALVQRMLLALAEFNKIQEENAKQ